jgi:nicotinamide riboside transporter PnuC
LDLIAAFSGLFGAFSLVWIVVGLFTALLLGTVAASLFVSIFYSASRLANAAERACSMSPSQLHQ